MNLSSRQTTPRLEKPIQIGMVGIGGYGSVVYRMAKAQPDLMRVAAACDPNLSQLPDIREDLEADQVALFEDYIVMLNQEADRLDAVWLSLPIHLHVWGTLEALKRGLAVMCEKPAAGCLQDVDAMIAASKQYDRPVLIGFQDIYGRSTRQMKQDLLNGVYGEISHITVDGCWPRPKNYFNRNYWAGRIGIGSDDQHQWVLDSPFNNAMAHFANLALFFAGDSLELSGTPKAIDTELYRAATIENFDTISLRVHHDQGPNVLVNYTHACPTPSNPVVRIHCEKGVIERHMNSADFIPTDGEAKTLDFGPEVRIDMVRCFAATVAGQKLDDVLPATLEVARTHSLLVSAVSEFTPITVVEKEQRETYIPDHMDQHPGNVIKIIPGISDAIARATEQNQLLSETDLLPCQAQPIHADVTEYKQFSQPFGG